MVGRHGASPVREHGEHVDVDLGQRDVRVAVSKGPRIGKNPDSRLGKNSRYPDHPGGDRVPLPTSGFTGAARKPKTISSQLGLSETARMP